MANNMPMPAAALAAAASTATATGTSVTAAMATAPLTVTSGNAEASKGQPYYDKLRRDLRETLQKKRILDKNLVRIRLLLCVLARDRCWLRPPPSLPAPIMSALPRAMSMSIASHLLRHLLTQSAPRKGVARRTDLQTRKLVPRGDQRGGEHHQGIRQLYQGIEYLYGIYSGR